MTQDRPAYPRFLLRLHWVSAVLVLVLISTGFLMDQFDNGNVVLSLLILHLFCGISVAVLTFFRLLWLLTHRGQTGEPLSGRLQKLMEKTVHRLFYLLLLLIPLTGAATVIVSNLRHLFNPAGSAAYHDLVQATAPFQWHSTLNWILIGLLALHLGAALFRYRIQRQSLFAR